MITLSVWDCVGLVIALALTCAVITAASMRVERRRFRAAIRAVERAAARQAIRQEYDDRLAGLTRRCDDLAADATTARQEAATARHNRDAAVAHSTAQAAALRRIDLLAHDLYRSGQPISARRIVAARRDCTTSEVVLGEQIDQAVGE